MFARQDGETRMGSGVGRRFFDRMTGGAGYKILLIRQLCDYADGGGCWGGGMMISGLRVGNPKTRKMRGGWVASGKVWAGN